jgi:hypothetical protein
LCGGDWVKEGITARIAAGTDKGGAERDSFCKHLGRLIIRSKPAVKYFDLIGQLFSVP